MQPYLFPYIGYFQLLNVVDVFVVYDDVNYIKKGFINRNSLLVNGVGHPFTFPIIGASQNKKINELNFAEQSQKFIKSLKNNYSKAPFFEIVLELIEKIIDFKEKNVSGFLVNSLIKICNYLQISTKILVSSQLKIATNEKASSRIEAICKNFKATEYYNAIGGKSLYNREDFEKHGIKLQFLKTDLIHYEQFDNEFVPWLSIIDVMMFNDVATIKKMLLNYTLD